MSQYKQDVFWNNLPYTKGRIIKKLGFLSQALEKHTFLKDIKNPYFIWTGTGKIDFLENKILESKIKNKSKNSEFYFYLYEPLCAKIGSYNRSFYSEFDSTENIKDIVSDEIESIRIFVKNNNIENFRIFTSDYNIDLIKNNYPEIKINCLDLFLRQAAGAYKKYPEIENKIIKKFWCGNWRYTAHRHLIMGYLSKLSGNYTWNLRCSYEELEKNNWFDLKKFKKNNPNQHKQLANGIEFLYQNKLSIDQNFDSVNVENLKEVYIPGHNAPLYNIEFLKSYKECFCAIINETRYAQPFGYFSEKTLTAIWAKLPFILVAPPYTLEYLKTFGFKTFDKWWDENYDREENHEKRLIQIYNLIDYINSKSINDLKIIYTEMQDILNHNAEIIKTIPFNDKIL